MSRLWATLLLEGARRVSEKGRAIDVDADTSLPNASAVNLHSIQWHQQCVHFSEIVDSHVMIQVFHGRSISDLVRMIYLMLPG